MTGEVDLHGGAATPTAETPSPVNAGPTGVDGVGTRVLPYGVGLVSALLVGGGFALGVYMPNLHNGLFGATFTAVGVFVVLRRPSNREGWLFVATGVAHAVMFLGRQYGFYAAEHEHSSLPAVSWVTWLGVWPLALVLVLTGVTIMSFPDGRVPSPRWRAVVRGMVVAGALLSLGSALWPIEYADNSLSVPHPLDVGGFDSAQTLWSALAPPVLLAMQLAWAACVVVRLRRARGDEARQLKWFVFAVCLAAVVMTLSLVVFRSPAGGVLAWSIVPFVAGAAILKYRLYDIDLVINKTLVVGVMAVVITAGYVAVVVGVGNLFGVSASPDLGLSLVATAIIAVAFAPARRRVQGWADRLVYGHRLTPYETLARLSTQLSLGGEQADLFAGLASTVADGVGAAEVTLWVGSTDELVAAASWPPREGHDSQLTPAPSDLASLAGGGRSHVRSIVHQGTLRGAVTLTKAPGEALTAAEDRLLSDLVGQAGLVIENVGLGAELQERLHQISVQAGELRAAAKRIVAAQDEARRRIERDLHDGAQQRLVTLALSLQGVSQQAATRHDDDLAARVEEARRQLNEALAELREMARGIHPAILTQEGLEAALGFVAERSPVPVRVEVDLNRRLSAEVEAAAYFVVSEALTNAAKHAGASSIAVSARVDEGRLLVEVADNGCGGADGHWGSGLQGLADRLATLKGALTVHSPADCGTRLRAEIPCG
jgi:signal transduction histidine kinase